MANDFAALYAAVNALAMSAGLTLRGSRVSDFAPAVNWIRAHLGSRVVIGESWPHQFGTWQWTDSKLNYGADPVAEWCIPPLPGRTTVDVYLRCHTVAARTTEAVKVTSANAAHVVNIVPTSTPARYGPLSLNVDAGGGVEVVKAWSHGTGASAVVVEDISVIYPRLTSPLAAGLSADQFRALDEAELDPDAPLSADFLAAVRAALEAFRDTQQVYYQWSGLTAVDIPSDRRLSVMPSLCHPLSVPVWPGTEDADWALTVKYRTENSTGDDRQIAFGASSQPTARTAALLVPVPDGTALDWYSSTLALSEGRRVVSSLPAGLGSNVVSVHPQSTALSWDPGLADYLPAETMQRVLGLNSIEVTTADVYGLSIWGR